jgi:hypothetical protein
VATEKKQNLSEFNKGYFLKKYKELPYFEEEKS